MALQPKVKTVYNRTQKPQVADEYINIDEEVSQFDFTNKAPDQQSESQKPPSLSPWIRLARTPVNPNLNVHFTEIKGKIPDEFKDCIIAGAKQLVDDISEAPACFCTTKEICKQHAVYRPSIGDMIELVEGQIEEINKDETSFEQNL